MPNNHYFSESADSELNPKKIKVKLLGTNLELFTASGTFSPDHIDIGTDVLIKQLETTKPQGNLLDIGCGWGPISIALALAAPNSNVYAIDVNHKSLALTKLNADKLNLRNVKVCLPEEIEEDIIFDEIWSNPPIRVGKKVLHEILKTWLPRLVSGGTARLVVQKNLGSDSLQKWLTSEFADGYQVTRIESIKGFRILKVTRN